MPTLFCCRLIWVLSPSHSWLLHRQWLPPSLYLTLLLAVQGYLFIANICKQGKGGEYATGQCILLSVVFTSSPPSHNSSNWALPVISVLLKVHKIENFLTPILKFALFLCQLWQNINILQKTFVDWAIIGGGTIFPRSPRTTRNEKKF